MRTPALIIGLVLLIAGGLIAAGVFSFTKQETVAKLGPMEITTTEQKKPAPIALSICFASTLTASATSLRRPIFRARGSKRCLCQNRTLSQARVHRVDKTDSRRGRKPKRLTLHTYRRRKKN